MPLCLTVWKSWHHKGRAGVVDWQRSLYDRQRNFKVAGVFLSGWCFLDETGQTGLGCVMQAGRADG
ncbi:hypothetical protein TH25_14605 [Thalassospira profundimaris]|uniref:Uncharacterized protein n=1 Tax=Thalassospira profundimaris TaxID=502049 RepID=A0A367X6H3_9PROT|nr:hypothetical protein TH25_14605 [Thalassospira profundimaris]